MVKKMVLFLVAVMLITGFSVSFCGAQEEVASEVEALQRQQEQMRSITRTSR